MFNPYRHIRMAALLTLFIGLMFNNVSLLLFGLILMMSGTVGGQDLSERRIELLEKILLEDKKETTNEETDSH